MIDLDKLDAAYAATTHMGTIRHFPHGDGCHDCDYGSAHDPTERYCLSDYNSPDIFQWIAAIHNAYPAIAAELRALRNENARLRIQRDALIDGTM